MSAARSQHEITGLLGAIRHGDQQPWNRLPSLVYDRGVPHRDLEPTNVKR